MKRHHALGCWLIMGGMLSPITQAQTTTYEQYQQLHRNLADTAAVTRFIKADSYLSDRLRRQWLMHLAQKQQWALYADYYQPSHSPKRRCYYARALYETQRPAQAFDQLNDLWQEAKPLPQPCHKLAQNWLDQLDNKDQCLWQRAKKLMQQRNYHSVKQMNEWFDEDDRRLVKQWIAMSRHPAKIKTFRNYQHPQTQNIIVDVLAKWVPINTDAALSHWQQLQSLMVFNPEQEQIVYRKVALYAAMRNRQDAENYFSRLDPLQTPAIYHEWRVRAGLKQGQWQDVITAYQQMPKHLQDKACWQYWYARAQEQTGDNTEAKRLYQQLSQQRHYYGFLASHRSQQPLSMAIQDYAIDQMLLLEHQPVITQIEQHYQARRYHRANIISYELANNLPKTGQYLLAKTFSDWGWHEKALWLANHSHHFDDLTLRFPLAYKKLVSQYADKYHVAPSLVYAVIRQESTFKLRVKSSAGALGLMQVIPSTAKRVSKRYRIPLKGMQQMYTADKNIAIGTAYLKQLAKRYHKHPVLMAAAYNAGPKQVDYWLRKFPAHDTDIWIETLPWRETRNYLKNIVAFDAVYQYRLGQTPSVARFMARIKRGKE